MLLFVRGVLPINKNGENMKKAIFVLSVILSIPSIVAQTKISQVNNQQKIEQFKEAVSYLQRSRNCLSWFIK